MNADLRKISDGIFALCRGAEDDQEFCNGVNVCLYQLGFDMASLRANRIRDRLDAKHHISILPAEYRSFLSILSKKPIQYQRLTSGEIKSLTMTVTNRDGFPEMSDENIGIYFINEAKGQNIAFNQSDESHFICICLEAIGRDVTDVIAGLFFGGNI